MPKARPRHASANSSRASRGPAQVRIIGGKWKGRKLKFNAAADLRPTLGRTRETLFNWIRFELPQTNCLDLFAGSGVLGLEALSQGASRVTFVDRSSTHIEQIQAHLDLLGAQQQAQAFSIDALRFLKQLQHSQDKFQIVFVDPPFQQPELLEQTLDLLRGHSHLRLVYVESNLLEQTRALFQPTGFIEHKYTRAGDAHGWLLIPA